MAEIEPKREINVDRYSDINRKLNSKIKKNFVDQQTERIKPATNSGFARWRIFAKIHKQFPQGKII